MHMAHAHGVKRATDASRSQLTPIQHSCHAQLPCQNPAKTLVCFSTRSQLTSPHREEGQRACCPCHPIAIDHPTAIHSCSDLNRAWVASTLNALKSGCRQSGTESEISQEKPPFAEFKRADCRATLAACNRLSSGDEGRVISSSKGRSLSGGTLQDIGGLREGARAGGGHMSCNDLPPR